MPMYVYVYECLLIAAKSCFFAGADQESAILRCPFARTTGGSDGIRDEALLDAAINAPFQSFDEEDVFPTIQQKAARLGYRLVKNHAFIDGNKRIGAHAMLVFLALNDIELTYSQNELSDFFLKIAV